MQQLAIKIQKKNLGRGLNFKERIIGDNIKGKIYKIAIAIAKNKTPNNLSGMDLKIA